MDSQELGSMYDYLAKIILLGPSGSGKYVTLSLLGHLRGVGWFDINLSHRSCLLHRFVKNEWRILSSQTIGVEFASKIIKVGSGARRKRIKLQVYLLWFSNTGLIADDNTQALGYGRH
jgi:hypothetical protein